MILCWIAKLFRNNTIYSICWKFINILYNLLKYIKNKIVPKTVEASKIIGIYIYTYIYNIQLFKNNIIIFCVIIIK